MLNASSKEPKAPTPQPEAGTTEGLRPWGAAAAILLTIIGFVASQLLAQIVISVLPSVFGWSTAEANQWLKTPLANFMYVLLAESLIIGLVVWFVRKHKADFWQAVGLRRPNKWDLPVSLLGFLCYIVVYAVVLMVVSGVFPINTDQEQAVGFAYDVRGPGLILAFFSLVILPPIVEETVFRGFLYGTLRRRNVSFLWSAIVVSAIFGLMHLFGGGSGSVIIWIAFLDTFVLSTVLCFIREKTGAIWASVGVHMLKNALVFVNLFIIANR